MIESSDTPTKLTNISSATGRRPVTAAPTAAPMKPISQIGVSMTRPGPNCWIRPLVAPIGGGAAAPPRPDLLARARAPPHRPPPGGVVPRPAPPAPAGDVLAEEDD